MINVSTCRKTNCNKVPRHETKPDLAFRAWNFTGGEIFGRVHTSTALFSFLSAMRLPSLHVRLW